MLIHESSMHTMSSLLNLEEIEGIYHGENFLQEKLESTSFGFGLRFRLDLGLTTRIIVLTTNTLLCLALIVGGCYNST